MQGDRPRPPKMQPAPTAPADATRRWRPPGLFHAVGVLLGLGAPLGFVALQGLLLRHEAGWRSLIRALVSRSRLRVFVANDLALAYMLISTPLVFGFFGRALGRHEEKVRASAEYIAGLREEFAAVVAHDLRTPIQAMQLQLELLLRDARDGEARVPVSVLHRLERGGKLLGQMVADLLDATCIEAACLSLHPQRVHLPDVVTALVERIRPTLGTHPVEVRTEGTPPPVRADPARLDQILTNLLENAAKYSGEEAPISVLVRPQGAGAAVSVKDRGPGIAPQELPLLFDRFYQAKLAREKKTGLGLGLYITKGLVEAHGGRVDVQTELGAGSTFSVWLPSARYP